MRARRSTVDHADDDVLALRAGGMKRRGAGESVVVVVVGGLSANELGERVAFERLRVHAAVGFDRARGRQHDDHVFADGVGAEGERQIADTAAWHRHRDRVDVVVGLRGLAAQGRDGGDGRRTWSRALDDQLSPASRRR